MSLLLSPPPDEAGGVGVGIGNVDAPTSTLTTDAAVTALSPLLCKRVTKAAVSRLANACSMVLATELLVAVTVNETWTLSVRRASCTALIVTTAMFTDSKSATDCLNPVWTAPTKLLLE
jgi:hypothetical protein